jgi:hypothetical protein
VVSRRQFFSGILKGRQAVFLSSEEREARYQALESDVQSELLPTHSTLTESEQSRLSSRIRSFLAGATDTELLSKRIVSRLKLLVENVLEPSDEVTALRKPQELLFAAIESVPIFLSAATPEQIDSLMKKFELVKRIELEVRLSENIATWMQKMKDTELLKYDSVSIQEPVFARLRELL